MFKNAVDSISRALDQRFKDEPYAVMAAARGQIAPQRFDDTGWPVDEDARGFMRAELKPLPRSMPCVT